MSQLLTPDTLVKYLFALVLAVIAYLQKRGQEQAAKLNAPAVVQSALDTLLTLMGAAVGNAAQTTVSALRDPNKPGTWDEKAKAAVRESVTSDVRRLGASAVLTLRENGYTVGALEDLLVKMRESAVNALGPQSSPLSPKQIAGQLAASISERLSAAPIEINASGLLKPAEVSTR